ncbi:hypothetical protein D3C80_2140080 [compost metagenome]
MSRVINAHRATGPAGKNLALRGQAMKQQLDGIGACHAADLVAHADLAALVSPRNGIALDLVMKDRACAG